MPGIAIFLVISMTFVAFVGDSAKKKHKQNHAPVAIIEVTQPNGGYVGHK